MVPRPNLFYDSIYTLCHSPPKTKSYFLRGELKLVTGTCTHNGVSIGQGEVFLLCVPFPNPNNGFFNMDLHTI